MTSAACRLILVLSALGPAASAQPAPAPARLEALDEAGRVLDHGLWNGRINALYDLGDMGRDGLPLLVYAGGDADWQVRLTAVHFLGKLGPAAAPALGAIARREPCPHVRQFALLWLSLLGPSGEALYREAAAPEDEDALARLPRGYTPAKMGKPLAIDAPDDMTADFFNGGLDLRVCASSEHSGRVHRKPPPRQVASVAIPKASPAARAVPSAAPAKPSVAAPPISTKSPETPSPAPKPKESPVLSPAEIRELARLDAEIDSLLAPGTSESLPPGERAPAHAGTATASTRFETAQGRTLPAESVAARPGKPPETFPPGAPGPAPRANPPALAEIMPDAGTGKPELDPIPALIELLSSAEPRRRARAADELGKRGSAAARAVPALRRALRDPDRRVRASAALALGSAGVSVKGVVADLRRVLRDENEDVRFSAGLALERIKRPH